MLQHTSFSLPPGKGRSISLVHFFPNLRLRSKVNTKPIILRRLEQSTSLHSFSSMLNFTSSVLRMWLRSQSLSFEFTHIPFFSILLTAMHIYPCFVLIYWLDWNNRKLVYWRQCTLDTEKPKNHTSVLLPFNAGICYCEKKKGRETKLLEKLIALDIQCAIHRTPANGPSLHLSPWCESIIVPFKSTASLRLAAVQVWDLAY